MRTAQAMPGRGGASAPVPAGASAPGRQLDRTAAARGAALRRAEQQPAPPPPPTTTHWLALNLAALVASAALVLGPPPGLPCPPVAAAADALEDALPADPTPTAPGQQQQQPAPPPPPLPSIIDRARLVPDGTEARLAARIADLQARTGWAVRLLTAFPDDAGAPRFEALRAGWGAPLAQGRAVAILADPSAPNMLRFFPGERVLADALPRRFFIELQARYGNIFERRKEGGDPEALAGAVEALLTCLEPGAACGGAVPGLAQEQRSLTALTSAAGGFVFGFASRAGIILPLAPLWLPLLAVYGVAPLVTRLPAEEAALPVAINLAAFVGAALLFRASPLFQKGGFGADRQSLTKEGQAERMRTEDEEEE